MSNIVKKPDITQLSGDELDALIHRLQEAIDFDLLLSSEDIRLLLSALMTLATMQSRLAEKDVTLHKLRKLLGMVQASEKLNHLIASPDQSKIKRTSRKKKPISKPQRPTKHHHALPDLNKGDTCPECLVGKVYKYEPAQLLRITGQTPFVPELHLCERLRCNACGVFFTAPLAEEVLTDGNSDQKYGYSARSLMVLNKYFAGAPFYRQESLQQLLGLSITASTLFDQCEYVANDCQPIFMMLKSLGADAQHFYLDDTTHRVLEQAPVIKKKRGTDKMQKRTGLYASGIIANLDDHDIVLFQTNIGHAGEFIDELLSKRQPDQPPPILMSDALSSNNPSTITALQGACNAHGRRQFVDLLAQFPDEVAWVLHRYKLIWRHEDYVIDQHMSNAERLDYHQQHSLPVMKEIQTWGKQHFADETVEENSGLGKAIAYFNCHFKRLTLFCKIEGAKLDNNEMEAMLKLIVRNRKNAYFYKTPAGAAISDVLTSIIATAMRANVNVFDYLNTLQRYRVQVKADPAVWMPWNYLDNKVINVGSDAH